LRIIISHFRHVTVTDSGGKTQDVGESSGGITTTSKFLNICIMDQNLKGRAQKYTASIVIS
jgi:hypothetical protein